MSDQQIIVFAETGDLLDEAAAEIAPGVDLEEIERSVVPAPFTGTPIVKAVFVVRTADLAAIPS